MVQLQKLHEFDLVPKAKKAPELLLAMTLTND